MSEREGGWRRKELPTPSQNPTWRLVFPSGAATSQPTRAPAHLLRAHHPARVSASTILLLRHAQRGCAVFLRRGAADKARRNGGAHPEHRDRPCRYDGAWRKKITRRTQPRSLQTLRLWRRHVRLRFRLTHSPPSTAKLFPSFSLCAPQHDAQLDFYGRRLATCSSDRTIKIFDVSGDEHTLTGEIVG